MSEKLFLDYQKEQIYFESSYRFFDENELHITRTSGCDVLVLVFEGILRFTENGVPVEVHAGQYYLQRRGLLQEGIIPSKKPSYFYIHFYASYCESPMDSVPLCGSFVFSSVQDILDELFELEQNGSKNTVEKNRLFFGILSHISKNTVFRPNKFSVAEQVSAYISGHFSEKLSLDSIASELMYSKDYIIRSFKSAYGITPHRFITSLRISEAKRLLSSTDRTVTRIASECGYDDISVFFRAFRAETGKAPEEWKKFGYFSIINGLQEQI